MRRIRCAVFLISCLRAAAADKPIAGPQLGYLYDPVSHSLRAIDGVAGASLLGPRLDPGIEISTAVISPDQSYALAITAISRTARILPLGNAILTAQQIGGPDLPVDRIALSPRGASAALYNASEGILQIVTGLPNAPLLAREIRSPGLGLMAISDDGVLVLAASLEPGRPLLLLGQSTGGRDIPVLGPVSAIAFRPNSHDVLVAASRLTLIRASDTDPHYQTFGENDGSAVALAFSRQGGRFFAAYGDGTIWSYDLGGRKSSRITCPCVPTILQPTQEDSVFLLNTPGNGPPFLLDGGNNRTVFVARGDL